MRFLRTTSTLRLLTLLVGLAALAAATAAIALAATSGGGAKPSPKPLAQAIHDALSGPEVAGVTARVKFTNHLIDSSAVTGSNPLISGASGRLWASNDGRVRIELQSTDGDVQLTTDGRSFLVYDGTSNTGYRGTLPQRHGRSADSGPPSIARIQRSIDTARQSAGVSGAIPTTVAGHSAYEVRVTPQNGGEVSGTRLAWDALRGVPLKVAVYARGNNSPVLELSAQNISYGPVSASVFDISPPKGAHVVDLTPPAAPAGTHKEITGAIAVQKRLPFTLSAPSRLGDLPREDVKLLGSGPHAGALMTYGKGLGGITVIEQKAAAQQQAPPNTHSDRGLQLPTVPINGTPGQELPTALGTVVRFTRGGVDYTVLASQPEATVVAAARSL